MEKLYGELIYVYYNCILHKSYDNIWLQRKKQIQFRSPQHVYHLLSVGKEAMN